MKKLTIGILPQEKMRERVIKIARGELKPKPGDPKVWFPSMRSMAWSSSNQQDTAGSNPLPRRRRSRLLPEP